MKLNSFKPIFSLLVIALLFIACAQPVPPEKMDYVGEWRSKEKFVDGGELL